MTNIETTNPVTRIRQTIFHCATQEAFAVLLGTTQATVSRWEQWGRIPGHRQSLIRGKAETMSLAWDDRWFFEVPIAREAPSNEGVKA